MRVRMKKTILPGLCAAMALAWAMAHADPKDLQLQGRRLVSRKPSFAMALASEFRLVHSFSQEFPKENSLTRVFFLVKDRNRQVEEMFILQIADRINPQAGPIQAPSLKPYTEKRMYLKGKKKVADQEIEYLIQLMAWNPDASSLQPLVKRGLIVPSRWAMQGQFLFNYAGEHAVLVRYSKDANTFGLKVSESGERWDKGSISGNEQRVYEIFRKGFLDMIDSIQIEKQPG